MEELSRALAELEPRLKRSIDIESKDIEETLANAQDPELTRLAGQFPEIGAQLGAITENAKKDREALDGARQALGKISRMLEKELDAFRERLA